MDDFFVPLFSPIFVSFPDTGCDWIRVSRSKLCDVCVLR